MMGPRTTIPRIDPYPMPAEADLTANIAPWLPDPDRAVLLVHDMQRYFVERFPAGRSPVVELVRNVTRLRRAAAASGVPVIYTAQPAATTRERRGLLRDFWGTGMAAHPARERLAEIVDDIAPGPDDVVVAKYRYSAFHGSELASTVHSAGRDQLIVCGVYAHIGCLMTACDAFSYDLETFLIADAVADFSAGHHRMALEYAAGRCAVVLSTDRTCACLTEVGPAAGGSPPIPTVPGSFTA